MKKFILLIILMPLFAFSQSDGYECSFIPDANFFDISTYSATVRSDFSNDTPLVFNVKFHILNPSNGINPDGLSEDDLLANIAVLNIAFNKYNIFYKYRGFTTLNSDYFYFNASFGEVINEFQNSTNNDNNNIHILAFAQNQLNNGGAAFSQQRITLRAINLLDLNDFTIVHEMGHLAGLLHPFEGSNKAGVQTCTAIDGSFCIANNTIYQTNADLNGDNIPDIFYAPVRLTIPNFYSVGESGYGNIENVTRDINNPLFNANIKGDLVVDTPATFFKAYNNVWIDILQNENYIPHTNIVDDSGSNEIYVNVDIRNFMDYSSIGRTHFTDGQGVRMRETILNPSNSAIYQSRMTQVSELYEPYAGEYFQIGPTLPIHRPLFQPGFDYKFVSCSGNYNTPSDYDDISFSYTNTILNKADKYFLELNKINHPNHSAIIIEQLESQPRKCYNNYNRSASNGTVIKFNDGVPNTNITVNQKNATQINDTNLIQNLDNGLYTIQKNYNDGSQEQQTILKNDN